MEEQSTIRMDEINIRIVLKDLLRNGILVIMAVLTVLMGVRTYRNIVYVPEYTSKATMAIIAKGNADGNAYTSLTTANSMAEVFAEVFQSSIIREKVEEVLGEMPAGTKISSKLIPETNLLELYVKARDPQSAYRVIQVILENYRYVSDYLFGNAVLEVIQDPEVPMAPSNSFNTSRLDKLGILGALVLMCGLITVLSVLRGTVKTVKCAKRNLEGACIAAIPYEEKNHTLMGKLLHRNKAILLNGQVVSFGYEECFHHLASDLEYEMDKKGQKTLLVTSVAENEGKSTVCVNLSAALSQRGKKVLLVDMDSQKPALYKLLGEKIDENQCLPDYLEGKAELSYILKYNKKMGIYALLSNKPVFDLQPYLCRKEYQELIDTVRKEFDYVILDSAPVSAGADVEALQEYVDASVLVVHQDVVKISDLNDAIEVMQESSCKFLGYILNAFDSTEASRRRGYGYGKYGSYGRYGSYGASTDKMEETEEKR